MARPSTPARPANHGSRRTLPMPLKRTLRQTAAPQGDAAVAAICAVIRRIPKGWVATYGQVAAMAGLPRRARLVGSVSRTSTRQPTFPGIVSSTPKARCPIACPAMAVTPCSGACWNRKASSSTNGTASTWSDFVGSISDCADGSGSRRIVVAGRPVAATKPEQGSRWRLAGSVSSLDQATESGTAKHAKHANGHPQGQGPDLRQRCCNERLRVLRLRFPFLLPADCTPGVRHGNHAHPYSAGTGVDAVSLHSSH